MEYIGKIENDQKLCEDNEDIVIFGAGEGLNGLLAKLEKMQVRDRIVCICDNNCEKQGQEISGLKVYKPEYVFHTHSSASYIVYNRFCIEICNQLVKEGINKIHLIRR